MKVVVDVNVMISRFITPRGHGSQIIHANLKELKFDLVVSREIIDEFIDVSSRKRLQKFFGKDTQGRISEYIDYLGKLDDLVTDPTPPYFKAVPTDPNDDKIIWCAIRGNADYIVSGDKRDLLPLKEVHGIRIVSPREFLEIIDS